MTTATPVLDTIVDINAASIEHTQLSARELMLARLPDSIFPLEVRTVAADECWLSHSYGRPSVVILSAAEYERLKRLDRQALDVGELAEADLAAIRTARIPKRHRYRSDDLR